MNTNCRFCRKPLMSTFANLGTSPLANAFLSPDKLNQPEPSFPLHARVCENCFLVQIPEFEPPEHIFSQYAYFSSYSDTWLEHSRAYTEMITERFGVDQHSFVVEIASNDGYLLQYFLQKGIPVLGIEPSVNTARKAESRGIKTITRFFSRTLASELLQTCGAANLIVANNVLAHVPNLHDFVAGLKILLGPGSLATIEFPHLLRLIELCQFDTIYHEHFSYFSFTTVQRIFKAHGLAVFDVDELPTHGGSLRLYLGHDDDPSRTIQRRVSELEEKEKDFGLDRTAVYTRFEERVKNVKQEILSFLIKAKADGKTVTGYGAPAKSSTLLNYCGIRTDFMDYTVDRNPYKQGLLIPGVHIPIYEPERLLQTKPDYLFILPWNIKEEIMEQMGHIREWGGRFVVPIPEIQVIE